MKPSEHRVRVARDDVVDAFGRELQTARSAAGLSQREVAKRLGRSQSAISRLESGLTSPNLRIMARVARAVGHRLSVRLFPADGIRLRDSGQLVLAEEIRAAAHRSWQVRLEVPVAPPPDRRAADMVLTGSDEAVLIEIERAPRDFQAQLRAAQLKRVALAERLGRRVVLVLAVPDTTSGRRAIAPHAAIVRSSFPVSSRAAWASVRSGQPLTGDALLWVRRRTRATSVHAVAASHDAVRQPRARSDARACMKPRQGKGSRAF
ncbi:MAG TPA: helix-turn-helix transcriptional regulator [Methylomirabilota bacterium]|nr:helix-turn-helix transcriptional regulator [Methylomirabilota bacterium]